MSLRVLIADDEAMARRRLERLVRALPDTDLVGQCSDGAEVLARVSESAVDVVLLDIDMPNLTGVEALQLLGADGPVIVFVTAHAQHAVAAFDGGAADYVLKPVEPSRLARALERARARVAARQPDPRALPPRLPVPTSSGIQLIAPAALIAATIEGESVVIHTLEGRWYTPWRLSEVQKRLPNDPGFMRVHRRAIVNLAHVERLEDLPTGGYVAHLAGALQVEVSRQTGRVLRRQWRL